MRVLLRARGARARLGLGQVARRRVGDARARASSASSSRRSARATRARTRSAMAATPPDPRRRRPGHAAAPPAAGGRRAGRDDAAAGRALVGLERAEPRQLAAPQHANGAPFAPHHYRRLVKRREGRAVGQRARQRHDADRRAGAVRRGEQPHPATRVPARDGVRQPPLPAVPRARRRASAAATTSARCPGSGFAHHPYTFAGGPNIDTGHRDDVTIA